MCEIGCDACGKGCGVDVLLRPDDIVHDDGSAVHAEVTNKAFRGAEFLYTLRLEDGKQLLSLVPSHHNHAVGEKIGIKLDVDHVIAHQANKRILDASLERLGVPASKCWMNLEKYGNTSAASVAIALDEAVRTGRVQSGGFNQPSRSSFSSLAAAAIAASNAGRGKPRASSSASITRPAMSLTGWIDRENRPSPRAAAARRCERTAYSSSSARPQPSSVAIRSPGRSSPARTGPRRVSTGVPKRR